MKERAISTWSFLHCIKDGSWGPWLSLTLTLLFASSLALELEEDELFSS